jgi:hypothetical protein
MSITDCLRWLVLCIRDRAGEPDKAGTLDTENDVTRDRF